MKLLSLSKKAYEQYCKTVKGNENAPYDQALKKLNRNIILVKEFAPERIHRRWFTKIFAYGNLDIYVKFGTIVKVVNHKGESENFEYPQERYQELSKLLGILDNHDKFSKRLKKVN